MLDLRKVAIAGVIFLVPLTLAACKNLYQSQGTSSESQTTTTSEGAQVGGTINYADNGFSPAEVKIKVGQKVEFKNTSSKTVQVNSAPHPTHTSFPELNINTIAIGETKSATFTKTGTYKYHNHLNASEFGTIVVE